MVTSCSYPLPCPLGKASSSLLFLSPVPPGQGLKQTLLFYAILDGAACVQNQDP